MELKVPPKICTEILDKLIKSGYQLLNSIEKDFWDEYDKIEKKLKKENFPSILGVFTNNVTDAKIEKFNMEIEEWTLKVEKELKSIFVHESQIYYFRNIRHDETQVFRSKDGHYNDRSNSDRLELRISTYIDLLLKWYDRFSKHSISPFFYDEVTCKLWFYDFVCPLKADTYMSDLCNFLFKHGIGEKLEYNDVYEFISGEQNATKIPTEWTNKINVAYREINKKTKAHFGFQIITKEKTTLSIQLPPQFLRALSH